MSRRTRQARLSLACTPQPTRETWLLRNALRELERAHQRGTENPRIALTAEQQHALDEALAEAARRFDIPPHRSCASMAFEQHGVVIRMWYHEDGHLYLMSDLGHRLLASLDAWA